MSTRVVAMSTITFRSRIDCWLVAVFALPLAFAVWRGIVQFTRRGMSSFVPLGVAVLSTPLVVWIFAETFYTGTPSDLLIHGGPVRVRVPLSSICRTRRSHSVLAAPSSSLRRPWIEYDGGMALISTNDVMASLAVIRERVLGVELQID